MQTYSQYDREVSERVHRQTVELRKLQADVDERLLRARAEVAPQLAELERAEAQRIAAQADRNRAWVSVVFAVGVSLFLALVGVANVVHVLTGGT